MATPERLMGVGVDAETAKRTGFFIHVVDDGLAYESKGPGNNFIIVETATSSITLGSDHDLGDVVFVAGKAVAVSLYAGTTGFIWPTSAAASHPVSADVARMFVRGETTAGLAVWYVLSSV